MGKIANLSNATTGDGQTIATVTSTNAIIGKKRIEVNAKLVMSLEELATGLEKDKRKTLLLVLCIKKKAFIK